MRATRNASMAERQARMPMPDMVKAGNTTKGKKLEINQLKQVKVDAKTIKIHLKVSDRFSYQIVDAQGEVLHEQDDGYVPDFMPGPHYGDYVILDIDVDTGQVTNWPKLTAADIEKAIKPDNE